MQTFPTKHAEFDWYLARARQPEPLDREAEHELAVRSHAGDLGAREQLLLANLRHVVSIAVRYRRYGVPIADLVSVGNIGLCIAVSKFDPERGTRFVTYAGHWIRAQMIDHILRNRTMVGGGSGAFRSKNYFRLQRERARIEGLVSDESERRSRLASTLGASESQLDEWLARLDARDVSLDAPLHDDGGTTGLDRLAWSGPDADEAIHARLRDEDLAEALRDAIGALDARERRIVEARALGDEGISLADIAREFGVTRERARQLEVRAHGKLRKKLGRFVDAAA